MPWFRFHHSQMVHSVVSSFYGTIGPNISSNRPICSMLNLGTWNVIQNSSKHHQEKVLWGLYKLYRQKNNQLEREMQRFLLLTADIMFTSCSPELVSLPAHMVGTKMCSKRCLAVHLTQLGSKEVVTSWKTAKMTNAWLELNSTLGTQQRRVWHSCYRPSKRRLSRSSMSARPARILKWWNSKPI